MEANTELEQTPGDQKASGILQTFWGLSSLEEEERLRSANQLITALSQSQEKSGGEEMSSDLEYTVKRLVRGLASNRKGARQGYFVSLTEVLCVFEAVPVAKVLKLIGAHLEPTGSDRAAEERGIYFGKLFALLALIRSGKLEEEEHIINVAKQLHSCSQKKSYLREFSYVSLAHLVDLCHSQGGDDVIRDHVIPLALDTGWEGCTVEQLFLYLHLDSIYGKEKWFRKYVSKKLGSKSVLNEGCVEHLVPVLLESTSAHPRLHSVWEKVLKGLRGKQLFGHFWKSVVEDALFSSSHERRYLGFNILESLLPTLTLDEVTLTLSPNLLSCLLNNSSAEDNYLHLAAKHLLAELSSLVESTTDKELLISLYLHIQRSTQNKFDQLCGVKLTEKMLTQLSTEGVELLLDRLSSILCQPSLLTTNTIDGESTDGHSVQLWGVDQLLLILRQRRLPRRSSWMLKATKILLFYSLFELSSLSVSSPPEGLGYPVPSNPLSPSILQALSQRLASALSDLSNAVVAKNSLPNGENSSTQKDKESTVATEKGQREWSYSIPGVMEDGGYFLTSLAEYVSKLMNGGLQLTHELSEEETEIWSTSSEHISTLTSKENLACEEKAFLLLFSGSCLQLLTSVEERHSISKIVQDLNICFSEMSSLLSKKKKTPKKRVKESEWMSVLVDVLLGLLSKSSQLWRNIVEQVFRHLTHCVTEDSLQLILTVLEPKQSKDDIMEVEEDGTLPPSDQETPDQSSGEESEGGGDSSEGGGDSSMEDGGGGDKMVVDPIFRSDVRRALGAAGVDSEEESGGSVDDEVMMAIDDDLAEVFRTRFALKHQKKVKKDEEKSLVHFKLRVLGLVEAFVRKETSNPLVLEVVVPLYEVIQGSQSRKDHAPLVEKAKGIFKNRLCHMKGYPKTKLNVEHIHSHLQSLINHLSKANAVTAPLLSQGFLLLVRVLRGSTTAAPPPAISPLTTRSGRKRRQSTVEQSAPPEHGDLDVGQVTDWVSSALTEFVTKKNSNINPIFFSAYIERYPSLGVHLLPKLIELIPLSANHFRKAQLYEMLAVLRGHVGGESPFDKLTEEDVEAIDALTSKSKRRKRTKHKQ